MTLSDDMVHTGASSTSMPRPSPTPTVHQPFETPRAFEMELHKKVTSISNRQDIFKLRMDLLDTVLERLMEQEDFHDGDLLAMFRKHKEACKAAMIITR